jgi:hypothetical protein
MNSPGAGTIRRGPWRMAAGQNEKGGSSDPPFSLNNFWFALLSQCSSDAAYASLGVSSLNSGRLNGRLFFAQIPAFANCLMCKRSYIQFL